MRPLILGLVCALALGGGAAAAPPTPGAALLKKLSGPTCVVDTQIPASVRAEVEKAAREFVTRMAADDAAGAWSRTSPLFRQSVTFEQLGGMLARMKSHEPYGPFSLEHIYEIRDQRSGDPAQVCPDTDTDKVGTALAKALSAPLQYHVLLHADTPNYRMRVALWMLPGEHGHEVIGLHFQAVTVAGRDVKAFLELARAQAAKGHAFNATFLYLSARGASALGDQFQTAEAKTVLDEVAAALAAPMPDLAGPPPWTWTLDGRPYQVFGANALSWRHRYTLVFQYRPADWDGKDAAAAEKINRATIEAFRKAHPDWDEAFDAIVVQALEPNGRNWWGTGFDREKGLIEPAGADIGQPPFIGKGP